LKVPYVIFLALWIGLISVSTYYIGIDYPIWVRAVIAGALGGVSAYLLSLSIERQRNRREAGAADSAAVVDPHDPEEKVTEEADRVDRP
jgi:hypothetical protein